jgi:hypothetical protein
MMDDEDWLRHCWEFDAARRSGRSISLCSSELHFALLMARHRQHRTEIERLFAEAAKDPAAWARLNKPL